ncbi:sensor domain-containing diguanylate cyclase [Motilimonas eburnea]|nr:sensor domain-containing diguanylate cyclase [Motilimonas eburnea]
MSTDIPKLKVVMITLGIFIVLMTLLYGAFMRVHGAQSHLEAFTELEIDKANYLNQAIYITGYGGFIHNFKNAVIRRDIHYLDNAESQVKQSIQTLDQYLALSPEHAKQVLAIQTVINQYRQNIPVLRKMIVQGASTQEIDARVKVDDTLAVVAIKEILNSHQQHPLALLKQTGQDYQAITYRLLIVVNILFVVSLLTIGYIFHSYKKLRIALVEKNIIFTCAPSAIIAADETGNITQANTSAMQLFEFNETEIGHINIDDLVPNEIKQKHTRLRREFQRSERIKPMADRSQTFTAQKRSGEQFPVDISIATYEVNSSKHSIVVVDDLSERERIKQQACTDALTGIGNRYAINQRLQHVYHLIKRETHPNNPSPDHFTPFAIAMVDIDFFKTINDEYGHQTGDIVLQQLAHLIQQHIRAVDFVGRWGGEEFLLILERVDLTGATKIMQKLIDVIKYASQRSPFPAPITVSAGIATYDKNKTINTLISQADQALYQAKDAGRDQVAVFSQATLAPQDTGSTSD